MDEDRNITRVIPKVDMAVNTHMSGHIGGTANGWTSSHPCDQDHHLMEELSNANINACLLPPLSEGDIEIWTDYSADYLNMWLMNEPRFFEDQKYKMIHLALCPFLFDITDNLPYAWIKILLNFGVLEKERHESFTLTSSEMETLEMAEVIFRRCADLVVESKKDLKEILNFIYDVEDQCGARGVIDANYALDKLPQLKLFPSIWVPIRRAFEKRRRQAHICIIYFFKTIHHQVVHYGRDGQDKAELVKRLVTKKAQRQLAASGEKMESFATCIADMNDRKADEIIQHFSKAIKFDPFNLKHYNNRAELHILMKNYINALPDCWRAIILDQVNSSKSACFASRCYLEMGHLDKAKELNTMAMEFCVDVMQKKLIEVQASQISKAKAQNVNQRRSRISESEPESLQDCTATVVFRRLQCEGSSLYQKHKYSDAVDSFHQALEMLTEHGAKALETQLPDVLILNYCYALSCVHTKSFNNLQCAIDKFKYVIGHTNEFPAAHYGLGLAYKTLNRFKEALDEFEKAMQNRKTSQECQWPQTLTAMPETNPDTLRKMCKGLIGECKHPPKPDAVCRLHTDADSPRREIYLSDPDYKGFVQVRCTCQCCIDFHPNCWKAYKHTQNTHTDKEMLDGPCPTPNCWGTIHELRIYKQEHKDGGASKPVVLAFPKEKIPHIRRPMIKMKTSSPLKLQRKEEKKRLRKERREEERKKKALVEEDEAVKDQHQQQHRNASLNLHLLGGDQDMRNHNLSTQEGILLIKDEAEVLLEGKNKQKVAKTKKKKEKTKQVLTFDLQFSADKDKELLGVNSLDNDGDYVNQSDLTGAATMTSATLSRMQGSNSLLLTPGMGAGGGAGVTQHGNGLLPIPIQPLPTVDLFSKNLIECFTTILQGGPVNLDSVIVKDILANVPRETLTKVASKGGIAGFLSAQPQFVVVGRKVGLARGGPGLLGTGDMRKTLPSPWGQVAPPSSSGSKNPGVLGDFPPPPSRLLQGSACGASGDGISEMGHHAEKQQQGKGLNPSASEFVPGLKSPPAGQNGAPLKDRGEPDSSGVVKDTKEDESGEFVMVTRKKSGTSIGVKDVAKKKFGSMGLDCFSEDVSKPRAGSNTIYDVLRVGGEGESSSANGDLESKPSNGVSGLLNILSSTRQQSNALSGSDPKPGKKTSAAPNPQLFGKKASMLDIITTDSATSSSSNTITPNSTIDNASDFPPVTQKPLASNSLIPPSSSARPSFYPANTPHALALAAIGRGERRPSDASSSLSEDVVRASSPASSSAASQKSSQGGSSAVSTSSASTRGDVATTGVCPPKPLKLSMKGLPKRGKKQGLIEKVGNISQLLPTTKTANEAKEMSAADRETPETTWDNASVCSSSSGKGSSGYERAYNNILEASAAHRKQGLASTTVENGAGYGNTALQHKEKGMTQATVANGAAYGNADSLGLASSFNSLINPQTAHMENSYMPSSSSLPPLHDNFFPGMHDFKTGFDSLGCLSSLPQTPLALPTSNSLNNRRSESGVLRNLLPAADVGSSGVGQSSVVGTTSDASSLQLQLPRDLSGFSASQLIPELRSFQGRLGDISTAATTTSYNHHQTSDKMAAVDPSVTNPLYDLDEPTEMTHQFSNFFTNNSAGQSESLLDPVAVPQSFASGDKFTWSPLNSDVLNAKFGASSFGGMDTKTETWPTFTQPEQATSVTDQAETTTEISAVAETLKAFHGFSVERSEVGTNTELSGQQVESLQQRVFDLDVKVGKLVSIIKDAERERDAEKTRCAELTQLIADLEGKVAKKTADFESLAVDHQALTHERDSLKLTLKEVTERYLPEVKVTLDKEKAKVKSYEKQLLNMHLQTALAGVDTKRREAGGHLYRITSLIQKIRGGGQREDPSLNDTVEEWKSYIKACEVAMETLVDNCKKSLEAVESGQSLEELPPSGVPLLPPFPKPPSEESLVALPAVTAPVAQKFPMFDVDQASAHKLGSSLSVQIPAPSQDAAAADNAGNKPDSPDDDESAYLKMVLGAGGAGAPSKPPVARPPKIKKPVGKIKPPPGLPSQPFSQGPVPLLPLGSSSSSSLASSASSSSSSVGALSSVKLPSGQVVARPSLASLAGRNNLPARITPPTQLRAANVPNLPVSQPATTQQLSPFDKLVITVQERFPAYGRNQIQRIIEELRRDNGGSLAGFTIEKLAGCIVERIVEGENNQTSKYQAGVSPSDLIRQRASSPTETTCTICTEDTARAPSYNVRELDCGHRFHEECIQSWLRLNQTCPNCRSHSLLQEDFPSLHNSVSR